MFVHLKFRVFFSFSLFVYYIKICNNNLKIYKVIAWGEGYSLDRSLVQHKDKLTLK